MKPEQSALNLFPTKTLNRSAPPCEGLSFFIYISEEKCIYKIDDIGRLRDVGSIFKPFE